MEKKYEHMDRPATIDGNRNEGNGVGRSAESRSSRSIAAAETPTCSKSAIIKATSNAFPAIRPNLVSRAKQTGTEMLAGHLKRQLEEGNELIRAIKREVNSLRH